MKHLLLSIFLLVLTGHPSNAAGLTIFAASSLREAFSEIGKLYEKQSGDKINFNFAGSQILRTQIEFGAPADLYAAASPENIKPLFDKGLVGEIHYFAGNKLILLLSDPHSKIRQIPDLASSGVQIAIGNTSVPVGRYSRQLLAAMEKDKQFVTIIPKIRRNIRTEESSVKAIVAKILLGEVDAGIVYRSDLNAEVRGQTSHLQLPQRHAPAIRYPLAVVTTSQNRHQAQAFIDLILGPSGQKVLQNNGFLPLTGGGA